MAKTIKYANGATAAMGGQVDPSMFGPEYGDEVTLVPAGGGMGGGLRPLSPNEIDGSFAKGWTASGGGVSTNPYANPYSGLQPITAAPTPENAPPPAQPAQPSNTLAPTTEAAPPTSTPANAAMDMASAWSSSPSASPAVAASAQSGLQAATPTPKDTTSQTKWTAPESSATNMAAIEDARKRQTLAPQQSAMSGLSGLRY